MTHHARSPNLLFAAKELFHLRHLCGIHFDERRLEVFKASAGEFLRRINAELAAAGNFAGGVIKHVGRVFGENAVALRVGIGAWLTRRMASARGNRRPTNSLTE